MSRFDDEMIAEEERPLLPFPPRTLEAWMQLNRTLDAADQIGTQAPAVVDWYALADVPAESAVQFSHYQAMARALNEGQLTYESWGKLAIVNPVVKAALDAAEQEEQTKKLANTNLRCDACLSTGKLETFEWAGALFIHLLTCQRFAKAIAEKEPTGAPDAEIPRAPCGCIRVVRQVGEDPVTVHVFDCVVGWREKQGIVIERASTPFN
jgi:hypothetical protein